MAMGRPPKPDSGYHVSIHKVGNYQYASTQPSSVGESGKKSYRHIHWGRLDENKKFIPGTEYILASPAERAKLIFPESWDLSELEKLSGARKQGRPAYDGDDRNRLYGAVWLLEQVADTTGLRKDLLEVFDNNEEIVNDIMTLAMYPLLSNGASYNRLQRYQRIYRFPSEREMTSDYITRLSQSITEQHRMDLFRLRAARLGKGAVLAVDSTSRSAYGHSLADIHWGKNKDHLPLKQTVEAVAYTLTEHMPVYYRSFPGNTPDSRGLQTILTDLRHAGFKDIILMTDRGYETIRNLEEYILKQQPMIMCTKVQQQLVSERIGAFEDFDDMARPEEMEVDPESLIYYHQYNVDYEVKSKGKSTQKADRMKVNLYLDPVRRSEELVNLDADLKSQRTALEQMVAEEAICDDDATLKRIYSYYEIEYAPDTRKILSFTENMKKIQKARKFSGFFSLVTHKLDLTAMETFEHYTLRDEQEKYFHQMKGQMGFDKQQNWSEDGKQGRLLILFVALIISSYTKYIWKSTKLKKYFDSSLAVIDEMRPIRMIEHTGRARRITPFVGGQIDICEAFGFQIPPGCSPDYVSRKKEPKRRGRPKKPRVIHEEK